MLAFSKVFGRLNFLKWGSWGRLNKRVTSLQNSDCLSQKSPPVFHHCNDNHQTLTRHIIQETWCKFPHNFPHSSEKFYESFACVFHHIKALNPLWIFSMNINAWFMASLINSLIKIYFNFFFSFHFEQTTIKKQFSRICKTFKSLKKKYWIIIIIGNCSGQIKNWKLKIVEKLQRKNSFSWKIQSFLLFFSNF